MLNLTPYPPLLKERGEIETILCPLSFRRGVAVGRGVTRLRVSASVAQGGVYDETF